MAGVERLELPTIGFGDRCSTNWNYTPITLFKALTNTYKSTSYTYRVNLIFLGIKRYSRSEALLYSAEYISQEVFGLVIEFRVNSSEK